MEDLGPAAEQLAMLVRGVRDDQLDAATPCSEYTVGDLLDHVGRLALAFTAAATKADAPDGMNMQMPSGDAARLADDWQTRIPADLTALAAAWRDPAAWDGSTYIAGGEGPAGMVGQTSINELVVHSWDLARATGQPFEPEDQTVEASFVFADLMAKPEMEQGRAPVFGPVVDVPHDRSRLDQLVASNGREPGWSPPGGA